jgi:cytochrome c oxidase subunit 1
MSAEGHDHGHDHEHEHHHKETFITKYIFSLTIMIAKQYLIYRYFHGNYRCYFYAFRMQLAWPEQSLKF